MGTINNALLLEKGLRADFLKAFNNGENESVVSPLIMETSSTSDSEKYGWLGEVAQMSEWVDERKLRGLADYDYTIPNRDYESTLKVSKNAMDDDQLGAVKVRIRDLAARAKTHKMKLTMDALVAGTVDLGYDGVPFFSASHPESGTNQSNISDLNIAGSAYTTAEFSTAFKQARAQMRAFTDDQGEPRNEGELSLYIVGSPDVEGVVDEVLSADQISSGTNTLKGQAKKIISSRLTGQVCYMIDASGSLKALVNQTRQGIKFESLEKGERAFMRKDLLFGVDNRVGFGYGLWSKAIQMTVS